MIDTSKYATKEELFKFLKDNKQQLITQKKFEMKRADAVSFFVHSSNEKEETVKASENTEYLLSKDRIKVKVIINTTKLFDSHGDVHIDGLWKKSLKEQKNLYLLQEHQMKFTNIISDDVKASAQKMTWKELGFDMEGSTEALVFDSEIEKQRNTFMFDQYARGYVKNHSVGMRYVQMHLCVNSDDKYYREEKENWDKYISEVSNKSEAEEKCFFWAVTEAKIIEGSAVPMGSNWATPTQEVKGIEPPMGTQKNIGPDNPPENVFEKIGKLNLIRTQ
jgi:hypothetical protein